VENKIDTKWMGLNFPGGHIDPGESQFHAIQREVREENGLTATNLKLVGTAVMEIIVVSYGTTIRSIVSHFGPDIDISRGPKNGVCRAWTLMVTKLKSSNALKI